jgi:hypothetical protein
VSGDAGDSETDTVTASGSDDEGNPVSASDDATVTVTDVTPTIDVDKTANPTTVSEPGGDVVFTVVIDNDSVSTDPVTIDSLVDDIHGDLNGQGTCSVPQTIPSGDTYSCSFSATVSGDAGDSETDTVTASGSDDEGNPVSASDDATVAIEDVLPSAHLTKTPYEVVVTFEVVVTNDSVSTDPLTIDALTDDVYGNITTADHDGIQSTTCVLGGVIQPGASYTCYFTAVVSSSPQTDVVTATVSDDEGNKVEPWDDAYVEFGDPSPTP